MAAKKQNAKSVCPITQNKSVRDAATQNVESIRDAFPKGIAAPALRALFNAKIYNLEMLTKISERDLSQLHGMGPKAISILKNALEDKCMTFAK